MNKPTFSILVVLVAALFCSAVACSNSVVHDPPDERPAVLSNSNANAALYALDEPVPPVTVTVNVPASVVWFDTGVTFARGQKFMLRAEGEWSFGKESVGPLGDIGTTRHNAIVPEAEIGSLVAKIGDEAFWIGNRYTAESPASGKLYLSINDVPGSFESNKGTMNVWITYARSISAE